MSANGTPKSLSAELRYQRTWQSLVVVALLCALTLILWWTLKRQEQANLQTKVRVESEYLASQIQADLRNRIPALQRMARRWERQGLSSDESTTEARAYLADVPGYQALEWADADYRVRWVEPIEGNERALGLNLGFEKSRRAALLKAKDSRTPAVTSTIELIQGGKGFLVFFPVFGGQGRDGWLVAVFRIQQWLDYVFSIESSRITKRGYSVSVWFDEGPVYRQPGWDQTGDSAITQSTTFALDNHQLTIQARPTPSFVRSSETSIPTLVAVFGFLLSVLMAATVFLFQKASAEAKRKHAAKTALEGMILQREQVQNELHRALVRFDLATKAGAMGVWSWDLASNQLLWNERMFELFEVPPDVSPNYETWRDALHVEDVERAEALLRDAVAGKAPFETEFRVLLPSGTVRHIRAAARVERDPDNRPLFVTGLNWDVTERIQRQVELEKSEQQVRLLLNSTAEAIYGIDLQGNCTFANPACARMLGYADPDMLIGKNMHDLIHHSYADGQKMPVESCRIYRGYTHGRGEHVDDEVLWRADGTCFPAEYWSYPQREGSAVRGAVVTFLDIADRKRAEEQIRHMANHDALTDLPSMRLVRDRLEMAIAQGRRHKKHVAVMFLDLDGFKAINDNYGHDIGDQVLKEVAQRLRAGTRATDTVARIGGDEFLLVLTEQQSTKDAAVVARKILDLLAQPIHRLDCDLFVGASIGIAIYPFDSSQSDHLIKLADEAMYKVKASGKNGYRFAESPLRPTLPAFSSKPPA